MGTYNSFHNSCSRWVQSLRRIVTTVDKAIHCIRAQSTSAQSRVEEETNTEQETCHQIPVVHGDDFPSTSAVFSRLLYKQHTREQSVSHSSWVQTTKKTIQRPISAVQALWSLTMSHICVIINHCLPRTCQHLNDCVLQQSFFFSFLWFIHSQKK